MTIPPSLFRLCRPLAGGDVAVVLWNRGTCGTHYYHSFNWTAVGLPADEPRAVRDLFLKADLGSFTGSFGDFVNPDGVLMVRLSKPERA